MSATAHLLADLASSLLSAPAHIAPLAKNLLPTQMKTSFVFDSAFDMSDAAEDAAKCSGELAEAKVKNATKFKCPQVKEYLQRIKWAGAGGDGKGDKGVGGFNGQAGRDAVPGGSGRGSCGSHGCNGAGGEMGKPSEAIVGDWQAIMKRIGKLNDEIIRDIEAMKTPEELAEEEEQNRSKDGAGAANDSVGVGGVLG